MPRPIWSGMLSFGLLHIPVQLVSGERPRSELHLRMLDRRDKNPVRYQRVNAGSGEEVPWSEVVKAYEYEKGSFVVLEEEDLKRAQPEGGQAIEIESFVEAGAIPPPYFEKPYYLVPPKRSEKGYVLLRETLRDSGYAGIARVVIRTKQYLALLLPSGAALMVDVMRFPDELVDPDELALPREKPAHYRITAKEQEMARKLIESMVTKWKPEEYQDQFRERLREVIEERVRKHTTVTPSAGAEPLTGTKVVDFMAALRKSLETRGKPAPAGHEAPPKRARRSTRASASVPPTGSSTRRSASPRPRSRATTRRSRH